MPRTFDWPKLEDELVRILENGPDAGPELAEALAISQPSFSRLIRRVDERVVAFGRARHRRYGLRRPAAFGNPVPVYDIDAHGQVRQRFTIDAIVPSGLTVDGNRVKPDVFDDLPWFFWALRPAGRLGRRVPRQLQGWPAVPAWSAEQTVTYARQFGWDLPGGFVVGDAALEQAQARTLEPVDYAARAHDTDVHDPGSWVGGMHPKFLAPAKIVKFSPPRSDAAGRRTADLLVAEHLALTILQEAGHDAAPTSIIEDDDRTFLEVERFDRTPKGRRSWVPLDALTPTLGEGSNTTSGLATRLLVRQHIDETTLRAIRFRAQFAEWIACADEGRSTLGFFLKGPTLVGLAPAFGLGPSAYAEPHRDPELPVRVALPSNADVAPAAHAAAVRFWQTVDADGRMSSEFRAIADRRIARLARVRLATPD
ncbi:MAG: HipA domain-containing protein [Myxococcota bacterium]